MTLIDTNENLVLDVRGLTKTYSSGERQLTVVDQVSFTVPRASSTAIVGPSGSGKTTLLGLCAGLDRPTSGTIFLNGTDLGASSEEERAQLRNRFVGFIFQSFQLLPTLTALENVMVPLELRGERDVSEKARGLLGRVGLGSRLSHYPAQLSGGEQQRVAIARAFVNRPLVLFADEPTGNLDTETGKVVEDLLFELNREEGTTLILVTHDNELASRAGRIIRLRGGSVVSDTQVESDDVADTVEG
ncbi:MAG: ABC transporter ATP-binding protein [Candidatus Latescibacterota bacterium]|jgi:putative ABC transport system ATP-binding protein